MITSPLRRLKSTIENASEFIAFRSPRDDEHKVVHLQVIGRKRDGREEEMLADVKGSRPFIRICPDYQNGITANRTANDSFTANGVIGAYIEKNTEDVLADASQSTDEDILMVWAEVVESLVWSIIKRSRDDAANSLRIESATIQKIGRSTDSDRNSIGDYLGADVRFVWGTPQ